MRDAQPKECLIDLNDTSDSSHTNIAVNSGYSNSETTRDLGILREVQNCNSMLITHGRGGFLKRLDLSCVFWLR